MSPREDENVSELKMEQSRKHLNTNSSSLQLTKSYPKILWLNFTFFTFLKIAFVILYELMVMQITLVVVVKACG